MAKNTCSVDGCERYVRGRGLCNMHYQRLVKTGDPLRTIGPSYTTTNLEHLRELFAIETDECVLWDRGGRPYPDVTGGPDRHGHRIVCRWAHGDPPPGKPEAAHSCDTPLCVNKRHLAWSTVSDNQMDRVRNGTSNRGERNGQAKLTVADVAEIRRRYVRNSRWAPSPPGSSSRELQLEFGVSRRTIELILRGERWI